MQKKRIATPLISSVSVDGMDRLRVVSPEDLLCSVIPLFEGRLQTRKEIQFLLFKDAVQFIKNREHLEPRNKEEILAFQERCREWNQKHHPDTESLIEKIVSSLIK